ncbi:MAG: hypothetical protein PHX04_04010 [Bacilli bacterium]|nr:hypothetical protein [Bacilli bacterium]
MVKKIKVILLLISLSVMLGLMSGTYSRYIASTNSDINASFSNWQIFVQNIDITNSEASNITLEPIIEENQHVATGTVAPSSKGHFDIDIDPTNVDVSFAYNINLEIEDENDIPDLMITKYAIIPTDYNEGDELEIIYLDDNIISNSLYYNKDIDTFKFDTFTIRVYFEWYEGEDESMDDEADTLIGMLAGDGNALFKMNANIEFEQILE